MNGSNWCMLLAIYLHVSLLKPKVGRDMFSKTSFISAELHGVTAQILFIVTAVRISTPTSAPLVEACYLT
jgi:hypothetical protein